MSLSGKKYPANMARLLANGTPVVVTADYSAFHEMQGIVRRTYQSRDGFLDHAVSFNGEGKQVCFSRHEVEVR